MIKDCKGCFFEFWRYGIVHAACVNCCRKEITQKKVKMKSGCGFK